MAGLSQDVREDINGNQYVNLQDGTGNAIQSTSASGLNGLAVYVTNPMSVSIGVADKTTFTYGTSSFEPVGGVFQDTSPTLSAGQSGSVRLTTNRGMHINLRTAAGVELLGSQVSAASVPVVIASDQGAVSVQDLADGSVAAGTAGTKSMLGGLVFNTSLPTLTTGQQAALQGTASGQLITADANSALINAKLSPATATLTSVAVAATSSSALASNAARKGAILVNDGIAILNVAFAATATTSAYTYKMQGNTTLELTDSRVYTGAISFIGNVATGNLRITELT